MCLAFLPSACNHGWFACMQRQTSTNTTFCASPVCHAREDVSIIGQVVAISDGLGACSACVVCKQTERDKHGDQDLCTSPSSQVEFRYTAKRIRCLVVFFWPGAVLFYSPLPNSMLLPASEARFGACIDDCSGCFVSLPMCVRLQHVLLTCCLAVA